MYSSVSIIANIYRLSIGEFKLSTIEPKTRMTMYSSMNAVEFSGWLQDEMNKRGWNNSELARRAGVTRGAIGNVLRGDRRPGSDLAAAIAKAFGMRPDEVFQIAGILPDLNIGNPAKEIAYITDQLSLDRQQQLIDFARYLLTLDESDHLKRQSKT